MLPSHPSDKPHSNSSLHADALFHHHTIGGRGDAHKKSLLLKNTLKLMPASDRSSSDLLTATSNDTSNSPGNGHLQSVISVLLIEDEPGDANLTLIALRSHQGSRFNVTWVSRLAEAKQTLEKLDFDIMLLDLSLPDSTGINTVLAARRMVKNLPLIVLTGRDDLDFALLALDAGASDYLTKGDFDHGGLVRSIRYALHRAEMEAKLTENTAQLLLAAQVLEAAAESIVVTDVNGVIESVNPAFTVITGYSAAEAIGKSPSLLKSGLHNTDFYRDFWGLLRRTGAWQGEIWNRRKNGEIYPQWLSIRAACNHVGEVTRYVAIASDLTMIRQAERNAEQLEYFDSLTSLPNRERFNTLLTQTLASLRINKHYAAVLILNLKRFREVNEARGVQAGDMLLKALATRLQESLHKKDIVSRLGGDEFAVLLTDLGTYEINVANITLAVAERLLESLRQPFNIGEELYCANACIGISLFSGLAENSAGILGQAQTALSRIKNQANQRVAFFENSMSETALKRYTLQQELRVGITQQELRPYLQPQYNDNIDIVGFEALVRWQHSQRGMIPPADFIPLAEESELIIALDNWMLEQVCLLITELTAQNKALPIAVNLSPRHVLHNDFIASIRACLARTHANPAFLILEVTEGLFLHNIAAVTEKMRELVALGLRFSMDDFGTGYSSLSYLKHLPLYELKIDQSFIRDLPSDSEDSALVETIIAVARILKLHVVAEGVETAAQSEFLKQRGPVTQQGYFLGKPAPVHHWIERLG